MHPNLSELNLQEIFCQKCQLYLHCKFSHHVIDWNCSKWQKANNLLYHTLDSIDTVEITQWLKYMYKKLLYYANKIRKNDDKRMQNTCCNYNNGSYWSQ